MTTFAKIQHRYAAVHSWPDAPVTSKHAYLKNEHRHLFHVTFWIEVLHDDREIEYMEAQDWLKNLCCQGHLGGMSCEMIAKGILVMARVQWPIGPKRRVMRVEVLEDGENGAYIED